MNTTSNSQPPTNVTVPVLRYVAAALSMLAGLIHFAVTPEHFEEAFEFGAFMAIAGTFQVVSSIILIVRPSRLLVVVVMVFNAMVVMIYTVAYTVGLPFGPDPGKPQQVNTPASVTTLGEIALLLVLIVVLIALVRRGGFHQLPGANPV